MRTQRCAARWSAWTCLLLYSLCVLVTQASAQESPSWTLTFYGASDVGCTEIDKIAQLPADSWQQSANLIQKRSLNGSVLWARLSPSQSLKPSVLLVRWHSNGRLSDWRNRLERSTTQEVGHPPGFRVLTLPQVRSEPILMCLVAPAPLAEAFVVLTPAQLAAEVRQVTVWLALMVGVMLAMAAMAFTFYLRLRAPVFGAYAVYLLCLLAYLLEDLGAVKPLLPAALSESGFSYALLTASIGGALVAGVRFTLRFTGIDILWPICARWLRRISLWVLAVTLFYLLTLLPYDFALKSTLLRINLILQNVSALAIILLVVPSVLHTAWRGRREARIFIVGWLPLLGLLTVKVLFSLTLLPTSAAVSPLWLITAAAFESLVLGWGLVDRARRDRLERDLAIQRSERDLLTGAHSRQALRDLLQKHTEEPTEAAVLLYLDIDHFKRINDSHGHHAGDRCLQRFAQTCQSQLRGIDMFARYGGEEFVAFLPGSDLNEGLRVAERIRARVIEQSARDLPITVSIGVAAPFEAERLEAWIARADRALYQAKTSGRNRVVGAE